MKSSASDAFHIADRLEALGIRSVESQLDHDVKRRLFFETLSHEGESLRFNSTALYARQAGYAALNGDFPDALPPVLQETLRSRLGEVPTYIARMGRSYQPGSQLVWQGLAHGEPLDPSLTSAEQNLHRADFLDRYISGTSLQTLRNGGSDGAGALVSIFRDEAGVRLLERKDNSVAESVALSWFYGVQAPGPLLDMLLNQAPLPARMILAGNAYGATTVPTSNKHRELRGLSEEQLAMWRDDILPHMIRNERSYNIREMALEVLARWPDAYTQVLADMDFVDRLLQTRTAWSMEKMLLRVFRDSPSVPLHHVETLVEMRDDWGGTPSSLRPALRAAGERDDIPAVLRERCAAQYSARSAW